MEVQEVVKSNVIVNEAPPSVPEVEVPVFAIDIKEDELPVEVEECGALTHELWVSHLIE